MSCKNCFSSPGASRKGILNHWHLGTHLMHASALCIRGLGPSFPLDLILLGARFNQICSLIIGLAQTDKLGMTLWHLSEDHTMQRSKWCTLAFACGNIYSSLQNAVKGIGNGVLFCGHWSSILVNRVGFLVAPCHHKGATCPRRARVCLTVGGLSFQTRKLYFWVPSLDNFEQLLIFFSTEHCIFVDISWCFMPFWAFFRLSPENNARWYKPRECVRPVSLRFWAGCKDRKYMKFFIMISPTILRKKETRSIKIETEINVWKCWFPHGNRRGSRILVRWGSAEFWPQRGAWAQNLLKIGVFP